MSVHEIGTAGYPMTGYAARKESSNSALGITGFMETAAEKARKPEPDKRKNEYDEKAFAYVGANAPEEVKLAWMEAAKEAGVNGLGMSENGMLTHLSKMMVQRVENWMNGIDRTNDILGDTVQSAIRATQQALYDLDHPLSPESLKSIEVQGLLVKERAFYQLFLDKLRALA
ncbi:MAG: hypothetical protein K2H52_15390 [Lachnospiraceae bacterium]|nr:hypothetical protein [Lachnospiraceae bacterium]